MRSGGSGQMFWPPGGGKSALTPAGRLPCDPAAPLVPALPLVPATPLVPAAPVPALPPPPAPLVPAEPLVPVVPLVPCPVAAGAVGSGDAAGAGGAASCHLGRSIRRRRACRPRRVVPAPPPVPPCRRRCLVPEPPIPVVAPPVPALPPSFPLVPACRSRRWYLGGSRAAVGPGAASRAARLHPPPAPWSPPVDSAQDASVQTSETLAKVQRSLFITDLPGVRGPDRAKRGDPVNVPRGRFRSGKSPRAGEQASRPGLRR